jgi:hypothetical protein
MSAIQRLIGLGVDLSTKKALRKALDIIGLNPDNIDRLYIELKNEIHRENFGRIFPEHKIVFLPQCLRNGTKCKAKIGEDGYECVGCSKDCKASEIKKLGEASGYKVFIVPGGSMVEKIVIKYQPKAVIGVACMKELVMALEGLNVPTHAIELTRDGCVETDVDIEKVKAALNV